MANRICLDVKALRVSKPGVNVLTANNHELAFSSDWSGMGMFLTGSRVFTGSGTATTAYGKTFPTLPFASFTIQVGSQYWQSGGLGWAGYVPLSGGSTFVWADLSMIRFKVDRACTIHYNIWDFSL